MISVCIPTYNGEKFIELQLRSILSQLSDQDEIIISDDSSNDRTVEIIRSLNDPKIILLEKNHFRSPIFNLENALKHAKGDIIFLSDQDDIWFENKIESMLPHLENHDLVLSNCNLINSQGAILKENYFHYYFGMEAPEISFWKNLYKNPFLGCSMAFRSDILKVCLPFPKKIAMHDIWIGLCCLRFFRIYFSPQVLFSWRRHEGNFTFDISRGDDKLSDFSFFHKIRYRLYLLYHLALKTGIKKP